MADVADDNHSRRCRWTFVAWRVLQVVALLLVLAAIAYLSYRNTLADLRRFVPPPSPIVKPSLRPVSIGYPYRPLPTQLNLLYISRRPGNEPARFVNPSDLLEFVASSPTLVADHHHHVLVIDGMQFIASAENEFAGSVGVGRFAEFSNARFLLYVAAHKQATSNNVYTVFGVNRNLVTTRVSVRYDDNDDVDSHQPRLHVDLIDQQTTIVLPLERVSAKNRGRSEPRLAYRNLGGQLLRLSEDGRPAHGTLFLSGSRSSRADRRTFLRHFLTQHRDYPLNVFDSNDDDHREDENANTRDQVLAWLVLDKTRSLYRSVRPRLQLRPVQPPTAPLHTYKAHSIELQLLAE